MSVSLEERLATFRKTHEPPPAPSKTAPSPKQINTNNTPGRASAPDQVLLSSVRSLQTVGEVEDTLYNDFVRADKRVLVIYLVIWAILFFTSIVFEFGAVYFVLSLLYTLWKFGLRQRKLNEVSAYSVFNPGVASIQGSQLIGEQMLRTMGIR